MKKLIVLLPLTLLSCKNEDWGHKVHSFAVNESYGIVKSLSAKDLEIKWYNYFFNISSFGLSEINKSNYTMNSLDQIDLDNVETNTVKLMSASYQLDQQIQKLYDVNASIYNAHEAYKKAFIACEDQSIFNIYTDNRSYLLNSLQMSMPQFNFTYGAAITFAMGDGANGSKSNGEKGIDGIPLIGNISTFFTEKKAKENKRKFQEGQDYINNLKLDLNELRLTSTNACQENRKKFQETFEILKANIELEKAVFSKLYTSLSKIRNALAPLVIKNIINKFSAEDLLIYDIQKDNVFTNRMMQMYQVANQLSASSASSFEEIESIENKIDIANDLISELQITKNSVLGIKNLKLISSLETLLTSKRNNLITLTQGRLK